MSDELNKQIALLEKLLKKEENKHCADCRRKLPSWASISHGVFICIKCAGFHRELGVHITKIKSINLDKWPKGVANLFTKINNKMANDYWEYKLKDMDFNTLQNDEYRLFDFIKDKYERKRYIKGGKDPMTLIYEGKEPEEINNQNSNFSQESDEEETNNNKRKKTKTPQPSSPTKRLVNFVNKQEQISQVTNNGPSLIDFTSPTTSNQENIGGNLMSFSNDNEKTNQPKLSGFSFMNNSAPKQQTQNTGNLIDLNSNENPKDTQIKQLTDNILNVYNNPTQDNNPNKNVNYVNFNQPNINIQNTYYNLNPNNNQNYNKNIMSNGYVNQNSNMYYGNSNLMNLNNCTQFNPIKNNTLSMGNNLNNVTSLYPQTNPQPNSQPTLCNNQSFNYDYFNNSMKTKNEINSMNYDLTFANSARGNSNQSSQFNLGTTNNYNKKTKEDPFTNLVSFK